MHQLNANGGALHNLCYGLVEKYSGKNVVFMTPIKRGTDANLLNSLNLTLQQYVDMVKEVCGYYGIPVIDMFRECTLNPSIPSQKTAFFKTGDDTHPNLEGQKIITSRVYGYLKQLR